MDSRSQYLVISLRSYSLEKGRLKKMREPILTEMEKQQRWQSDLRVTITTSTDEKAVAEAKLLFDESVKYYEVLTKSLEEHEKLSAAKWKFSPDTLLVVAGNLIGIMLILNFEKLDIVRSKAMSFVLKNRL